MTEAVSEVRVLSPKGAELCPVTELKETLAGISSAGSGPVWLHGTLTAETLDHLEATMVHELALKSLRGGPVRPRVEEYTDHLYLALFFARPEAAGSRLRDLRIFLGPQWLLSLADLTEDEYALLRSRVERNVIGRSRGAGHLLYVIVAWAVETLDPLIDATDQRVDDLEDRVILSADQAVVRDLFVMKREIAELRRQTLPLRDVMQRLSHQGVPFVEPEAEVYVRDVHDDLLRVVEVLDSHREMLAWAFEIYESAVSNRLNETMKWLTVVATLFMPITFITGFFGMNFEMLPFGSSTWFAAMLGLLAASVVSMLLIYRRSERG